MHSHTQIHTYIDLTCMSWQLNWKDATMKIIVTISSTHSHRQPIVWNRNVFLLNRGKYFVREHIKISISIFVSRLRVDIFRLFKLSLFNVFIILITTTITMAINLKKAPLTLLILFKIFFGYFATYLFEARADFRLRANGARSPRDAIIGRRIDDFRQCSNCTCFAPFSIGPKSFISM